MITVENVSYTYARATSPVLRRFSASFAPGAVTAITGGNGCGKTTLTKLIVGTARPSSGRILIDGVDTAALSLAEIGRQVGCVYQNPAHQLFCASVLEEMAYGLRSRGLSETEIARRSDRYLTYFDLAGRDDDFPPHLSHGEKQRLMLAVVLALRPAYVVLDEPTTGLDVVRRRALGEYLRRIAEDHGCGVLVVSHEREFVARYADVEVSLPDPGGVLDDTRDDGPRPAVHRPQRR